MFGAPHVPSKWTRACWVLAKLCLALLGLLSPLHVDPYRTPFGCLVNRLLGEYEISRWGSRQGNCWAACDQESLKPFRFFRLGKYLGGSKPRLRQGRQPQQPRLDRENLVCEASRDTSRCAARWIDVYVKKTAWLHGLWISPVLPLLVALE